MKYLTKFETINYYNLVKNDLILPNISLISETYKIHYNPYIDPFNGYEYVDLGLPSGTLWATDYITDSEDNILRFKWGNTIGSTDYNTTDKYYDSTNDVYTKYNSTDGLLELELVDDAAHVLWGGDWKIPNEEQIKELFLFCKQQENWGNSGWYPESITFISLINDNSITISSPYFMSRILYDDGYYNSYTSVANYVDAYVSSVGRSEVLPIFPIIEGTPRPLDRQFTTYETGYIPSNIEDVLENNDSIDNSEMFNLLKYFYKWINRPYEDLIADAEERNDSTTLYALDENDRYGGNYKEAFYNEVIGNDYGMSAIFDPYGSFSAWTSDNETVIQLWLHSGGGYYLNYYPSTGYVSIYLYDD